MDLAELWDYDRPGVSEQRFRAALATATDTDALVLRTQLARALGLQRRFAEATAELDALSLDDAGPLVRTYAELERGRVLNSSGDPNAARPHFLAALAEAEAAGLDALAADAAHMMAIVESGAAQIPWAERALAIAGASDDPRARRWIGSVSNNLGWTLHDLGRNEEALAVWQRALAFREEQGDVGPLNIARWTVARGLRSLGRYEEALAIQLELAEKVDSDGYVQEELGELMLALGRPDEARPHFARAHEVLSADEWLAGSEPDRLARLAELGRTPGEADSSPGS
ncbi:MAG TPA: tetratricopeptide repeat protein [Micromonosporaceae bacterium]|nr:tetratricopeptide repeat protein [Micromonosporaceae bacterium]